MNENTVIHGDCITAMEELPSESVDLIVADPPYNLSADSSMGYDGESGAGEFGGGWEQVNEDWDGFTIDGYQEFTERWITESKRVLKDDGSMFVFGTYHNIGFVNACLQQNAFKILNEIIWYKRNAFPNLSQTRLTASHENILWVTTEGNGYTFNYDWVKETEWPHDAFDKPGTQVRSVWNIPTNKTQAEQNHDHPTQKPLSVIDRVVQLASDAGDVVLDPFAGSGTTLVSAKRHDRAFIGIEKDESYVDMSRERVGDVDVTGTPRSPV